MLYITLGDNVFSATCDRLVGFFLHDISKLLLKVTFSIHNSYPSFVKPSSCMLKKKQNKNVMNAFPCQVIRSTPLLFIHDSVSWILLVTILMLSLDAVKDIKPIQQNKISEDTSWDKIRSAIMCVGTVRHELRQHQICYYLCRYSKTCLTINDISF